MDSVKELCGDTDMGLKHTICACAQQGVCYFVLPVISRINESVNRDGIYPQDEQSSCTFFGCLDLSSAQTPLSVA